MFAKKVKNAKFSRACGGRVYPSLWLSKIRYIAPVVCFSEDQSENINRKVVTQCLPASGYNRNFPRKVVYGPTKFGGMGWESCLSVMIVEKIKFITTHMRRMDKLGTLLQILLEIIQLQSGLAESILVSEVKWQIWVEPTWVNNLKDGLDIIKGALHTNHEIPQIQRNYDRSLMKVFSGWKISDKELKAIQRCRIYLQVIFMSDITTINGDTIELKALLVEQFRESELQWSRQVRPTRADRNVWRKYVEKLCYNGVLITTLGNWKIMPHQRWPYMLNTSGTKLRRYIGGVQKEMDRIEPNKYNRDGRVTSATGRGIPVCCIVTPTGYKTRETVWMLENTTNEIMRPIFESNDKALNKTMGHVTCQNLRLLRERWSCGDDWYIGTDGGLKDTTGTCGVTMYNKTLKKELCHSMSAEKCGLDQLHSTREEIRDVVAAEGIIGQCNNHFGATEQTIEFVCDNKSALGKIEYEGSEQKKVAPLAAEAELLMELTSLRKCNDNIIRSFKWVKSHRDEEKDHELSIHEQINQRADELATNARDESTEDLIDISPKQIYKNAIITLTINGSVVSKDLKKVIAMALYGERLIKYLKKKYGWDDVTFDNVDWNAHQHELEKTKGLFKISIYKMIHRWQPTNKITQRNEKKWQVRQTARNVGS